MKPESIKMFQCPNCNQDALVLIESKIECSYCKSMYPLINNIPRFVSQLNYADSFGYQWNMHRRTQLDSYTGFPISKKRLFEITQWPEKMEGEKILEAGSGAGRFTEVLIGTGAEIFSFDYSSAVDANWSNNGSSSNLHLFQADIYNIPLKKLSFDKVICLGVLQHTPDPERAFKCLVEYVRPGGEIVIDVYRRDLISLLHWKYLLRPLTKRINKHTLYKIIESLVPIFLPLSRFLTSSFGKIGRRMLPIAEYSHLGLPYELNKQWAILDTFDMYSPEYDYPQTMATVERWFKESGLTNILVCRGPNGIVGKGYRPEQNTR